MERSKPSSGDWVNKTLDASMLVEGGGLTLAAILGSYPGVAIACLGLATSIVAKNMYNNE